MLGFAAEISSHMKQARQTGVVRILTLQGPTLGDSIRLGLPKFEHDDHFGRLHDDSSEYIAKIVVMDVRQVLHCHRGNGSGLSFVVYSDDFNGRSVLLVSSMIFPPPGKPQNKNEDSSNSEADNDRYEPALNTH